MTRDDLRQVEMLVDALRQLHQVALPAGAEVRLSLAYSLVHPAIPGTPAQPATQDDPGALRPRPEPEWVETFAFAFSLPTSTAESALASLNGVVESALAGYGLKVD